MKKLIILLMMLGLAFGIEYMIQKTANPRDCKSKYTINVQEVLNDDESIGIDDEPEIDRPDSSPRRG